ncbi:hypothetical protein [Usitatibacter rugosus]|nr:hypothetical protein [Usitatibacter rugosus]
MNLKRGIAVLVPVVGFTVAGFASAQLIEPVDDGTTTTISQDTVIVAPTAPIAVIAETPVLLPGEEVVVVTDAPIIVADASGNPYVLAQGSTVVTSTDPYRIVTPVIEIPRSVSRRSGENSREEVAIRTAPVDIRAGLAPEYLTDQSPGGGT